MLHPAATSAGRVTDVIDERVPGVRRAVHQPQFVATDFTERVFHLALAPVIAVDDDVDGRSQVVDGELLEVRGLYRRVGKRVIAGRRELKA